MMFPTRSHGLLAAWRLLRSNANRAGEPQGFTLAELLSVCRQEEVGYPVCGGGSGGASIVDAGVDIGGVGGARAFYRTTTTAATTSSGSQAAALTRKSSSRSEDTKLAPRRAAAVGSGAASATALAAAPPITAKALMAAIKDATHLSCLERALLDHGAHFK